MKKLLDEAQRRFREVHHLHRRVVEKRVERTGVFRSQHMTLMYLSCDAGCSQKDIAEAHRVSSAAVAVNLKKLEQMGLVERIVDEEDNRCNRITITEKGSRIVEQSRDIFQQISEEMFSLLTDEEMEVFVRCLDKLQSKLEHMEGDSAK
jgi:DNA-binding MarR family transcriptional regulator